MCEIGNTVRWQQQRQNVPTPERARMINEAMMNLHADMVRESLTQTLFLTSGYAQVLDERPWWRKKLDWLRYRTIGRFREWLHRDCGGDW